MFWDRDSGCQIWKDRYSWGCERAHSSKNAHQKADLHQVLQENNKMFDGTLAVYPHKKVHIDIDPNSKPVHSKPYPVPQIHLKTFKTEPNHLVRIGVLASQQESEWVPPSFIIPERLVEYAGLVTYIN
jgi:hypothetical protein